MRTKKSNEKAREKEVPEYKVKLVKDLSAAMKKSKTVLVASTKGLPSSQFHDIKKKLRGKADIRVAKKTIVIRALELSGKPGLKKLEDNIKADVAIFLSDIDAFSLSGLLSDNQSSTKAKAGDIPSEDVTVEPGPTDLIPGPAISELSGAGLKVSVEGGKLAIKLAATIAKAGEPIKENVAGVMAKLGITPMKVGFEPIAAYDSDSDKVYVGIKIDKKGVLEELKASIAKALGFAANIKYPTKETAIYFIKKAGLEFMAIENKTNSTTTKEGI
jgi:large subunit ribosomal protein L10